MGFVMSLNLILSFSESIKMLSKTKNIPKLDKKFSKTTILITKLPSVVR